MEHSFVAMISDSDHAERRFRCLGVDADDPFGLRIEYKKKIRMNFEVISSGNRKIGTTEVATYVESQMRFINGKSKRISENETETWFYVEGHQYNYRHILSQQINGDIFHLTIQDICLGQDYSAIKKWFLRLKMLSQNTSKDHAGDLVHL